MPIVWFSDGKYFVLLIYRTSKARLLIDWGFPSLFSVEFCTNFLICNNWVPKVDSDQFIFSRNISNGSLIHFWDMGKFNSFVKFNCLLWQPNKNSCHLKKIGVFRFTNFNEFWLRPVKRLDIWCVNKPLVSSYRCTLPILHKRANKHLNTRKNVFLLTIGRKTSGQVMSCGRPIPSLISGPVVPSRPGSAVLHFPILAWTMSYENKCEAFRTLGHSSIIFLSSGWPSASSVKRGAFKRPHGSLSILQPGHSTQFKIVYNCHCPYHHHLYLRLWRLVLTSFLACSRVLGNAHPTVLLNAQF